jgi:hypothetical protein
MPQLALIKPEPTTDMHADPAAAHAMALGLPFCDVQRVTERRDEFGKLQSGQGRQRELNWRVRGHVARLPTNAGFILPCDT